MREEIDKDKKNYKKSILIGVATVTIITIDLMGFILSKNKSTNPLSKYTNKFFKYATDNELETEREKVRLLYNDSLLSENIDKLYNLLHKFDKVMAERANDCKEWIPPVASEHGWYLED